MIHAFAACELDTALRVLRRGGTPVHVEPLVFDLLVHLVQHRDRLVSKDELIETLWHGRIVSDAALTGAVAAARRAIGDTGAHQGLIRTVPRRGFRFAGHIEDRGADPVPLTLPAPLSSFLGRENELTDLADLFRGGKRLVTLTNVGGVGKTRLALRLANELAADFADGVRLIELAGVTGGDAVAAAVAGALGISQRPGLSLADSIARAMQPQHALLLVDNCEHVIDRAAALIGSILRACPRVAVVATSREILAIEGEHVFAVPPLSCEGLDAPAVRLFLERAHAAAPEALLEDHRQDVMALCRDLDGLPLAIEIAAARIRTLAVNEIRHRMSERFRVLTGVARNADPRHQSLHQAIAWSFDLLSATENTLLARASVFAGGFTLAAAEAICTGGAVDPESVLDVLDALVRKSLVNIRSRSPEPRYALLETIREFAAAQLAAANETAALRGRHAAWFAAQAWENFDRWRSPREASAYVWLEHEFDNLRAAFRWSCEHGQVDAAARIAASTGDMARFRLREEAATWPPEIVDRARDAHHPCLGILLTWCASWAWGLGRLPEAKRYGEAAIALAGADGQVPFCWAFADLAMIGIIEGDRMSAAAMARAGAAHPADARDRFCLALSPYLLAACDQIDAALALADDAVAAADQTRVPFSAAIARWSQGKALASHDVARALAAFDAAARIARDAGDPFWEIMASLEHAALQARAGQADDALRSFRTMLAHWRHSRDLMVLSNGLGTLVVLFERLGLLEPAAVLTGALTWAHETSPTAPELPAVTERLRARLGEAAFAAASARGAAMTPREANDYALGVVSSRIDAMAAQPTG